MERKLLPCETRPTRLLKHRDQLTWQTWDESTTKCLAVEISDSECINRSLYACKPYIHSLLHVLFRVANYVNSRCGRVFLSCSILDICGDLNVDQDKIDDPYGYIFWLIYQDIDQKKNGGTLRHVLEDMALVSNSYRFYHDLLQSDFNPCDVQPLPTKQQNDRHIHYNDSEELATDLNRQLVGTCSLVSNLKDRMDSLEFNIENGSGCTKLKKIRDMSDEMKYMAKIKTLAELDKALETYHFFCFNDNDSTKLTEIENGLRGKDTFAAWERRHKLLSPEYLFNYSVRRNGGNRELEQLIAVLKRARQNDQTTSDIEEIRLLINGGGCNNTAKNLECHILADRKLNRIDTKIQWGAAMAMLHFPTWELDIEMCHPTYFINHEFPSLRPYKSTRALVTSMTTSDGKPNHAFVNSISHLYATIPETNLQILTNNAYRMKNPGIVKVRSLLQSHGCNAATYTNPNAKATFFKIYNRLHQCGKLPMAEAITNSYNDSIKWFAKDTGFDSRCLNAMPSPSTGKRVPLVYDNIRNLDIGYQFLFNFLQLISTATGTHHTIVEVLYILLSGVKQLRPHKSMSFHGLFLGPPGTGKSRLMAVAQAIVGKDYSFVLNYRSKKSTLVPQNRDLSKKICFNPEFVVCSSNDRSGNPLANEQSSESAAMKEELDTGYTRSMRVESVTNPDTGHSSHVNVETDNVCDYATFMAMNEKNLCPSLDSRMVTFEVPPASTTVVPSETDTLEFKVEQLCIPQIYGSIRHLVMEASRLQEVGLYPHRIENESPIDYRAMIATWERLGDVCEEIGILYGLKNDMRARGRVFEMAIVLAEIFAIVKVYGCPPREVWQNLPDEITAQTVNFDQAKFDRIVEAHIAYLTETPQYSIHDEISIEKTPDPSDIITAFSMHYQFLQKDRMVARAIVIDSQALDPTSQTEVDNGARYFRLAFKNENELVQKLERTSGLSAKRCKDALLSISGMKYRDKQIFKIAVDSNNSKNISNHGRNQKQQLLFLSSYAAELYVSEQDDKLQNISARITSMLESDDRGGDSNTECGEIMVDEKLLRSLAFIHYLEPSEPHVKQSDGKLIENFHYTSGPPYEPVFDESYLLSGCQYKVNVSFDLHETRLKFLQSKVLDTLRQGDCKVTDEGYLLVEFGNPNVIRRLHSLHYRMLGNSANGPVALVRRLNRSCRRAIHWSIFCPEYDRLPRISIIRQKCIEAESCINDFFCIEVDGNDGKNMENIKTTTKSPAPSLHFANTSSNSQAYVSLLCLNQIDFNRVVSSKESIIKNVVEKTVFANMTERKSIVYVDRSSEFQTNNPFYMFNVLDIDDLTDKCGGQLPEYTCINPYKNDSSSNATIAAIQGDVIGTWLAEREPERIRLEKDHVAKRKAYVSLLADSTVAQLEKSTDSVAEFTLKLKERVLNRLSERRGKYKAYQWGLEKKQKFPWAILPNAARSRNNNKKRHLPNDSDTTCTIKKKKRRLN